jgi:hypothetical protein
MLKIPSQGITVRPNPPPSTDIPDDPKNRQLIYITLNDQILSQIQASGGKGMSVTFGANAVSPSIHFLILVFITLLLFVIGDC